MISHFEKVFGALQRENVRFLVVGGVAAIAHGVVRYTNDLDLVLAFDEDNLLRGIKALESTGLKPKIPISAEAFSKEENRRRWALEKNMMVFQLAFFTANDLPVDVFMEPPFDFDEEYVRAGRHELAPDLFVPVVSAEKLIEMKQKAGRPRDLDDIAKLQRLRTL